MATSVALLRRRFEPNAAGGAAGAVPRRTSSCRFCEAKTSLVGNFAGLCVSRRQHESRCRWAEVSRGLRSGWHDLEECHAEIGRLKVQRQGLDMARARASDEAGAHADLRCNQPKLRASITRAGLGPGNVVSGAEELERWVLDLEKSEDDQEERLLYLEDSIAFLTEQADAMLQADLRNAAGDEFAKRNALKGHSSLQIGDVRSIQQQCVPKTHTDSDSGSTATPCSTAPSLAYFEDMNESPSVASQASQGVEESQVAQNDVPCGVKTPVGAKQGARPTSSDPVAMALEFKTQMSVQWQGMWSSTGSSKANPAPASVPFHGDA